MSQMQRKVMTNAPLTMNQSKTMMLLEHIDEAHSAKLRLKFLFVWSICRRFVFLLISAFARAVPSLHTVLPNEILLDLRLRRPMATPLLGPGKLRRTLFLRYVPIS